MLELLQELEGESPEGGSASLGKGAPFPSKQNGFWQIRSRWDREGEGIVEMGAERSWMHHDLPASQEVLASFSAIIQRVQSRLCRASGA